MSNEAAKAPTPLVILGVGGNSVDVLDTVNEINAAAAAPCYRCLAFLDDNPELWGQIVHGIAVRGPLEKVAEYPQAEFVLAIGSPSSFWKREAVAERLDLPAERYATIVHPTASVSRMSTLGRGTVVLQNVTIASNVRVGHHVMILPNTVISHHDVIGEFTEIAGGVCLSGKVTVGRSCYLGSNSTVRDGVRLGDYCLIGMGSVIVGDVPSDSVYAGCPGRYLRPARQPESRGGGRR
jgi:sugar O-acyltransferase (sialic acid O-acetyltransferase NeuD family)